MKKERPILFSAPMVRAVLEGRKTQTRRVVKPQPEAPRAIYEPGHCREVLFDSLACSSSGSPCSAVGWHWSMQCAGGAVISDGAKVETLCPYGKPGDRLWVKETFAVIPGQPYANGKEDDILVTKADCGPLHAALVSKWKPSIFMPRNLSRITLEITNVRVERLQDISEADAISEGVVPGGRFPMCARGVYADLWDSINGEGSWDKNPWVWVIEFRHER